MSAVANTNEWTSDALIASWRAAQRKADTAGVVLLNEASVAGQLLDHAGGDAEIALTMLPETRGAFWSRVSDYLHLAAREERT